MKAVRVHKYGGPEVLSNDEVPIPEPKAGEARVKIEAIGLNFIDVYQRTGLYPLRTPFTLGMEGAGVVDAIGDDVSEVKVGDRVAYAMILGSYAEYAIVPAAKLAPLPANVEASSAAGLMLQGMTAHYLAHSTYRLQQGDTALIHAAAGGVGLLLIQIAKMLGARVIGTVGTEAKAQLAKQAGADAIILYTQADFLAEVKSSPRAKASTSFTTRWARRRSIKVSTASVRAATSCSSANRAAQSRRSIRGNLRRKARYFSPVQVWRTTCSTAPSCCSAPTTCSIGSRLAN